VITAAVRKRNECRKRILVNNGVRSGLRKRYLLGK
jgi:hypothetical protein